MLIMIISQYLLYPRHCKSAFTICHLSLKRLRSCIHFRKSCSGVAVRQLSNSLSVEEGNRRFFHWLRVLSQTSCIGRVVGAYTSCSSCCFTALSLRCCMALSKTHTRAPACWQILAYFINISMAFHFIFCRIIVKCIVIMICGW